MKFYLSTTADFEPSYMNPEDPGPCAALAAKHNLGLEIADFCICDNLDGRLDITEKLIRKKMDQVSDLLMHAPFNELCPAAIDPRIRQVAKDRYLQTFREAEKFGARKIVVHAGFNPLLYRREWFVPESVAFWKDLLGECPRGLSLVLENVLEADPQMLMDICDGVGDSRFGLCLDIGHANLTDVPVSDWTCSMGKRISHMHIHNNDGRSSEKMIAAKDDLHHGLGDGKIDVGALLKQIHGINPEVTVTVETTHIEESVDWLKARGYIS